MSAVDELKNLRKKDYLSKEGNDKNGMNSGMPNSTPRTIKLSDDEQKYFSQSKPGDDLACEVHGTLEEDGKFRVMSVQPLGGQSSYGNDMAGDVAQKVMPTIQPSPSA